MLKFGLAVVAAALFIDSGASAQDQAAALLQEKAKEVERVRGDLTKFVQAYPVQGKAELKEAQQVMREMMKDPATVQFRRARIVKKDGLRFVCGEINAKNSYGGYVGFQRFISTPQGVVIMDGDKLYQASLTLAIGSFVADAYAQEDAGIDYFCGV